LGKEIFNPTSIPHTDQIWNYSYQDASLELDLRQRFNDLIQGFMGYEGLGQFIILRSFDRSTHTPGYDRLRGGSTDDAWDQGEAYNWTEQFVFGHFTQTFGRSLLSNTMLFELTMGGIFDQDKALCYLMAGSQVKTGDELFRVKVNEDGSTYYPIEIKEKWRIIHAEDRRQEHQKVAFYICVCERMQM
jgi:hypothetical protein